MLLEFEVNILVASKTLANEPIHHVLENSFLHGLAFLGFEKSLVPNLESLVLNTHQILSENFVVFAMTN